MPKRTREESPRTPPSLSEGITVPKHRSEASILADLEAVCTEPGFAHSLALLCWRENFFGYNEKLTTDVLHEKSGPDCLIRSELSLLTRLMLSVPLDLAKPAAEVIENQIEAAERLLRELHNTLNIPYLVRKQEDLKHGINDLTNGQGRQYREPIFYAGESAYHFQYRDFAVQRYTQDVGWLLDN